MKLRRVCDNFYFRVFSELGRALAGAAVAVAGICGSPIAIASANINGASQIHFDYTDSFAVIQHCDATYLSNKLTTQQATDVVRLFTHKWENETPNFESGAMCQASVLPPGLAQSSDDQMKSVLDNLRERRRRVVNAIQKEIAAIHAMHLPPTLKRAREQQITQLNLQKYLDESLVSYSILSMTPQTKAKATLQPLLKAFRGNSPDPICRMYAELIPAAGEKDTEEKLDVLIHKQLQHWNKGTSIEDLEGYKQVGNRGCALAWLFWNRCVTDQFHSQMHYEEKLLDPARLRPLFQKLRCYTDQVK